MFVLILCCLVQPDSLIGKVSYGAWRVLCCLVQPDSLVGKVSYGAWLGATFGGRFD